MKVLVAYSNKQDNNPFVHSLFKAIKGKGIDINISLDEFWNNYSKYDIIHIHWPNSLFKNWKLSQDDLDRLRFIINDIKELNIKIIYTRHNEIPHYSTDILKECYSIIEKNSNTIVHLGEYGKSDFKKKYLARQVVIPHHIYKYDLISKEIARKKMGIDNNSFVILCFGAIRKREEGRMILNFFRKSNINNKLLLAPSFGKWFGLKLPCRKFSIKRIYNWFKIKKIYNENKIIVSDKFISESDIPYYFSASDLVFISRVDSLNSGLIPLAFSNAKAVLGPDIGNIGQILRDTNNLIFNSQEELIGLTDNLVNLDLDEIGNENFLLANEEWSLDNVSDKYIFEYKYYYE